MQTPPPTQLNQPPPHEELEWVRHPMDQTVIPQRISFLVSIYSNFVRTSYPFKQIEGKYLYNIDIARLRQHAVAINDIFSIPSDNPLDGTPDYPVAIPHISGEEFSYFVNWFNQQ